MSDSVGMDWSESDPGELLSGCLSGDQRAWGALVDRFAGVVQSVARAQGLSAEQRDDVVQIVFAILFRRLESIEDPESLPKWLMVTTRRECWRQIRSARRHTDLRNEVGEIAASASSNPGEGAGESLEMLEEQSLLRAGLTMIGEKCRRLLLALFGDSGDASYERVSEQVGIPVGSIGPTRARCLKRLLERIEGLRES
ncbi:MAG: sigma-70 family RNA polymerase sigma factor [Phycisphaerales bacterium]|nr:sigma-70 family RNA polymerase sigma factor [Phycisphaerales bacterium]